MPTMTLAIPKELKDKMDKIPELNWSEIARQSFKQRIKDREIFEKFKENSEITEEDALKWGREVSKRASNKLREFAKKNK